MRGTQRRILASILAVVAMATVAFAQGPLREKINYTVNVEHSFRLGKQMLPPGKYVLHQVQANDPNLFALYRKDTARSPIATIRTTRVRVVGDEYPQKAGFALDFDESGRTAEPVLEGWVVPGEDGWQVISVEIDEDELDDPEE